LATNTADDSTLRDNNFDWVAQRSRFRAKASALIVAGLFEGEIVRRGQRRCKRGMLRSAGQDDTAEQMNLQCRREAEPRAPGPAAKFGFQILASCGSHKGGKTAYRQAKSFNLIERIPPFGKNPRELNDIFFYVGIPDNVGNILQFPSAKLARKPLGAEVRGSFTSPGYSFEAVS